MSCSVGWLGAVASFLVVSVAGVTSPAPDVVRGAYVTMNVIGLNLIVPLSFLALLTGLVQSLGTDWGLVRYYWVLVKFVLTMGATMVLLLHQFTAVAEAAGQVAISPAGTLPNLGRLGTQLVVDAGLAAAVLLGLTAISIVKPWGRRAYGRSKLQEERTPRSQVESRSGSRSDHGTTAEPRLPRGLKIILVLMFAVLLAIVAWHFVGGRLGIHGHGPERSSSRPSEAR